jgi:cysteine desulfurase
VGTIQHINAMAKTVKEKGVLFHTDAVQAVASIPLNVKTMEIDAMTISSHKLYGPKGIGALYVKKGVAIKPLLVGGSHEFNHRAGTVNVACAIGFGKAIEIAIRDMQLNSEKIKSIREYFIKEVKEKIANVVINGHHTQKLPHIASVSFSYVEADAVSTLLDLEGIAVSTGAACSAGDSKDSHVLKAMGLSTELVKSTIRFSFTKRNTKEEIDYVIKKLEVIIERLREISPLTQKSKKGE